MDWSLSWRRDAHTALTHAVGQSVRTVYLSEHLFTTTRVHPSDPHQEHGTATWLLGGLVHELDAGYLRVFNALDENGLSVEPPGVGSATPDCHRMTLVGGTRALALEL